MLGNIRKFSGTIFAKILLVIIIIPFVFWGMGGVFNSGNTNSLAKINNFNISTQDFIEHLDSSRINNDIIKENINNNILEELLGQLISSKILKLEIEDLNIVISEKTLVKKIKNNKKFLDKNNKFSRTEYEKFLLSNNLIASEFEKNLKENELQEDLFKFISGGIKSPFFLTNNIYKKKTRKIDIQYINLEKLYKSKEQYSNQEIKTFITENKDALKRDYIDFSYAKITPINLIGVNEYNKEFFIKIDEIENKISNQIAFDQLINEYKLKKTSKKNYISSDDAESLEDKIYKMRDDSSLTLIDQEEYFLLLKIEKISSKIPELNDLKFINNVKKMLFNKNKYEYNKNLLNKINNNNFNNSDFIKLINNDNSKIQNLTLESIKDSNKFNSDSVKIIYSLPINSYSLIADDKNNVYLAKILKENVLDISKNDKNIKKYHEQSIADTQSKIYSTYDNFLNTKYKIKINEKTLERVKNYFR